MPFENYPFFALPFFPDGAKKGPRRLLVCRGFRGDGDDALRDGNAVVQRRPCSDIVWTRARKKKPNDGDRRFELDRRKDLDLFIRTSGKTVSGDVN